MYLDFDQIFLTRRGIFCYYYCESALVNRNKLSGLPRLPTPHQRNLADSELRHSVQAAVQLYVCDIVPDLCLHAVKPDLKIPQSPQVNTGNLITTL